MAVISQPSFFFLRLVNYRFLSFFFFLPFEDIRGFENGKNKQKQTRTAASKEENLEMIGLRCCCPLAPAFHYRIKGEKRREEKKRKWKCKMGGECCCLVVTRHWRSQAKLSQATSCFSHHYYFDTDCQCTFDNLQKRRRRRHSWATDEKSLTRVTSYKKKQQSEQEQLIMLYSSIFCALTSPVFFSFSSQQDTKEKVAHSSKRRRITLAHPRSSRSMMLHSLTHNIR